MWYIEAWFLSYIFSMTKITLFYNEWGKNKKKSKKNKQTNK